MECIQVSRHLKHGRHVGFRKFVFGKTFHLVSGITAADEPRAKVIAQRLTAHAEKLRSMNGIWTDAAIKEAYDVPAVIVDTLPVEVTPVTDLNVPVTKLAVSKPQTATVNAAVLVVATPFRPTRFLPESIWLYPIRVKKRYGA